MGALIDYYFVLGIQSGASADEIKQAYWRAARTHHPDMGGDHRRMKTVNEAYEILSDPGRRAEYDQDLARAWATAEERARPHDQAQSAPPRREAYGAPGGQREPEHGPLYRQWQVHEDQVRQAKRRAMPSVSDGGQAAFIWVLIAAGLIWLWLGYGAWREGAWYVIGFLLVSEFYWLGAVWVAVAVTAIWEEVARWLTRRSSPT